LDRRRTRPKDKSKNNRIAAQSRHAVGEAPVVRRHAETRYGVKSWKCQRRASAPIEASRNGLDIRYVVTNIARGSAEWLHETLYSGRGQAENPRLRGGRLSGLPVASGCSPPPPRGGRSYLWLQAGRFCWGGLAPP
jgi:hypothetical protein